MRSRREGAMRGKVKCEKGRNARAHAVHGRAHCEEGRSAMERRLMSLQASTDLHGSVVVWSKLYWKSLFPSLLVSYLLYVQLFLHVCSIAYVRLCICVLNCICTSMHVCSTAYVLFCIIELGRIAKRQNKLLRRLYARLPRSKDFFKNLVRLRSPIPAGGLLTCSVSSKLALSVLRFTSHN